MTKRISFLHDADNFEVLVVLVDAETESVIAVTIHVNESYRFFVNKNNDLGDG